MLRTDTSAKPGLVSALTELVISWGSRVHGVLQRRGSGATTAIAWECDPVDKVEVKTALLEEGLTMHCGPGGQGTVSVPEAQLTQYLFQKSSLASVQRQMPSSLCSPCFMSPRTGLLLLI